MKYVYKTNCVNSTAGLINAMVDNAREIKYRTFLKYVPFEDLLEVFPFYFKSKRQGLTIKDDYYVSYYRSIYNGKECVYVNHSSIEYIFIKEN